MADIEWDHHPICFVNVSLINVIVCFQNESEILPFPNKDVDFILPDSISSSSNKDLPRVSTEDDSSLDSKETPSKFYK